MSSITRTYSLRPFVCHEKKTSNGIDLHDVLEELRNDATLCAEEALKHITVANLGKVSEYDGLKPAEVGRQMGIKLSSQGRGTGRSRFEKMVQEYAVSQLRSWRERLKANTGQTNKYFSTGYKRTVSPNKPSSLEPRLALSATDERYRVIRVNGSTIELDMVVNQRWVTFRFASPQRFHEPGVRVIAPTISIDDQNRVIFNWYIDVPVERAPFSDKYVIGVDVGLANHATAVVRDITTGEVVEASFMNRRVRSLENKIQRAKTQINALYRKGCVEEVESHRKALSNRRKELSILVGQEVADLSYRHDNALVAVEDLSHMANTMRHGRWISGLIVKRVTEMVESNGGRVMTVNPAYTSQLCHRCGTTLEANNYHIPICTTCHVGWDCDENAASNIAMRLKGKHKKSCATRKKHSSKTRRRNSKDTVRPLKHPLKKNSPTPKAPQNRPKTNHAIHHKKVVVEKREGVYPILCAAGWSLRDSNVRVPAVVHTSGSDKKPHDYPTNRDRSSDLWYPEE